jgi:hypothetical protein
MTKTSPLVVSTATMEPRLPLSKDSAFFCKAKSMLRYKRSGHGPVDVKDSIAQSCDVFNKAK